MSAGGRRRASVLVAALAGLATGLAVAARPADADDIERNFAGSAQLDYLAVPTEARARPLGFDGFTAELSLKLAVDFTEHLSASVKVCYGCHGFETNMAYVDLRADDLLNVRVGRIVPAFGDFPLRADPANHRASSKPLPYDMGRMLRKDDWNLGVLPAPYVDNGVELSGSHWFGRDVQLGYAAYVVSGLKGSAAGFDVDFVESRSGSLYYVDNNSEPAVGGRVSATANLGPGVSVSVGASAMAGRYDRDATLGYQVGGVDVFARLGRLVMRGEYLFRRTEFARGERPEERFRYAFLDPGKSFSSKDGFYVEAELPLWPALEVFARLDGLGRRGNVAATSALRSESRVFRTTAGANWSIVRGLRLKLSAEVWDFSDFEDELALHVGVVASF
jgi:hypothetical protein